MFYNVISWLVFGLVVGAIARFLVPGKQPMHWMATIALGILGSFLGGGISYLIFGSPSGTIDPAGLVLSIVGAVVLVLVYCRVMISLTA
jgi:uncharacterized membrane protein YeaQ/YmgE (transglycosylase-associated protein family)